MAEDNAIIITPSPPWGDPWTYPEYFTGITSKRIFAYLIDVVAVSVAAIIVWVAFGLLGLATLGLLLPLQAVAVALTPLVYHTAFIASQGSATLGMRVLGIRVASLTVSADAGSGRPTLFQAMIQTVAFYGSIALTSFLILVVALFNSRRRMVHDWLAGTVVVNDLGRRHLPAG